ncbi:MAG: DUF624 domain-containing protein [Oscillospiraceae bacterium]|nr:DUF624 domain-containing protein [Oscillospiraceae bacterium]
MYEKNTILDKLMKVLSVVGNAIMLNLLFLVSCLPVVTIGPAVCALLSAIRYNIRGDRWFDGYKAGFTTRFWRSLLAWCIMLPLNVHMLLDVRYDYAEGYFVHLVVASIVLALTAMVTTALLVLNVYIPTKKGTWITNATNMVFKAPLMLLGAAALFVLPVLLALLWFEAFFFAIMIFIAVYFPLAALVTTMLLKNTLMQYLIAARADGSLLAEEGRQKEASTEETEEEE